MEEMDEEMEPCPVCDDKGCPHCYEEAEEEESEDEVLEEE